MSLLQQVLLRYRSDDHLRFELPASLCGPSAKQSLITGIGSIEGVYRVDLYANQRKLSIRFMDSICDVAVILRRLRSIILALPLRSESPDNQSSALLVSRRGTLPAEIHGTASRLSLWLQGKVQELKETITALQILAKRYMASIGLSPDQKPRWLKEFLNDLLMLFLIKIHWHHILHEWLPKPWTYRYEWAATVYLIYLSVESRSSQAT